MIYIILLSFIILSGYLVYRVEKLEDSLLNAQNEMQVLRSQVRRLFWNIGNQREKVSGILRALFPLVYKRKRSVESKNLIINKIMKNINY